MFTSRRQSEAIETRSVFSSTIHHAYVVHIQENAVHYSCSAWPLTSRLQAAFPPAHPCSLIIIFLFFLPVVGR